MRVVNENLRPKFYLSWLDFISIKLKSGLELSKQFYDKLSPSGQRNIGLGHARLLRFCKIYYGLARVLEKIAQVGLTKKASGRVLTHPIPISTQYRCHEILI